MTRMFIPITKVDAVQQMVYGVAASEVVDKSGEIFDYDSSKPHFESWSEEASKATDGKSKGNVRVMHTKVAAGRLDELNFDDANRTIEVAAKIIDRNEWEKVTEGVYTGFSIGGSYARKWKDGDAMRYTAVPSELSLVDNPCVPTAHFTMIKADGIAEERAFKSQETPMKVTNEQIAARAKELAKVAGDESAWPQHLEAASTELNKAAEVVTDKAAPEAGVVAPPVKDAADALGKSEQATDKTDPPLADGVEQVWLAKDGSTHKKKADALAKNVELAKADSPAAKLEAGLDSLKAQLDKAAKKADGDEEDKKDGGADETAEDDKGKKKAAKDAKGKDAKADKDMEAAAKVAAAKTSEDILNKRYEGTGDELTKKAFSDKKRKELADSGAAMPDGSFPIENKEDLKNAVSAYGRAKNKAKAKAHIKARAKALGAESELPDDWQKATTPMLKKFTDGGTLAKGLDFVCVMARAIEDLRFLQMMTQWEAEQEGDASTIPADLKQQVAALCDTLCAMCEEETSELIGVMKPEDVEILETAHLPKGFNALRKFVGDAVPELAKAGARHSKADMDKIQAVHDHSVDLGAECVDKEAGATEKIAGGDLAKALEAANAKVANYEATMTKALGTITELGERVVKLEAQPKARPRELVDSSGTVRIVDKSADGSGTQMAKTLEQMIAENPEAVQLALIKIAQQNPIGAMNRGR